MEDLCRLPGSQHIMRILIIKTTSMGDVVHALPVATDLARHFRQKGAELELDWVVEDTYADLIQWHPAVGRTLPVAVRRWRNAPFSAATRSEWKIWRDSVRGRRYGLVLDLQGLIKSALLSTQAIGPRAGFDRASVREPLATWAYGKTYAVDPKLPPVERVRKLAGAAVGYQPVGNPVFGLRAPPDPGGEVCAFAGRFGEHAFAVLLHGTAREEKRWPDRSWRALLELFEAARRFSILPWGNPAEQARARALTEGLRYAQVAPAMTMAEVTWLMSRANLVAGVDTGLLHLAAAYGAPLVGIFTATDPRVYFPDWLVRAEAVGGVAKPPTPDQVRSVIDRIGRWH